MQFIKEPFTIRNIFSLILGFTLDNLSIPFVIVEDKETADFYPKKTNSLAVPAQKTNMNYSKKDFKFCCPMAKHFN